MRGLIALAAVIGLATVGSASAQIAPGYSGSSSMESFDGQPAWDTLSDFGTCYAVHNRAQALEFVSTRPDSVEEAQAYKRLFRKETSCLALASELRTSFQMVRGAVAEGLYYKGVPVPTALAVHDAPTIGQIRNFMDASLCYAAAHREEVRTLLAKTRLGSKAEDRTISSIREKLSECIPPGARKINIPNQLIRVRLAEAMWRLGETAAAKGAQ